MAARFWVGSGTWDNSNATNWSATSGGAGGASVPTTADTVTFDVNSGTCSVVNGQAVCSTLTLGAGFVSTLNSASGFSTFIDISGTSAVLTPGACTISQIVFNLKSASAATTLNANFSNCAVINSTFVTIGYGIASTATFTLTTNGNFYKDSSFYVDIEVHSGTFSAGTVNMTGSALYVYNGTYNAAATTVTLNNRFFVPTSAGQTAVVALGTSTINATNDISIGPSSNSGAISVTVGATQTLSASTIDLRPTVAGTQQFRTLTAANTLNISIASGVNLAAGVVTCNGGGSLNAVAGYTTLPTVAFTSYTGNCVNTGTLYVNDVGFTCGAISITSSGFAPVYGEFSKGTVNITGTITLTDTTLSGIPEIQIFSAPAFSGTPTVTYSALNPSVRGRVLFQNTRAVSTGAITALYVTQQGAGFWLGNITTGAITIGGTLSAVVYDSGYVSLDSSGVVLTVTIASIAQGTGAVASQAIFGGLLNLSITGTINCAWFKAANTGTAVLGNTLTVVNNSYNNYGCVEFVNCSSVTCTSITITGLYAERGVQYYAIVFGDGLLSGGAQVGAVTMSGTLTVGSAGNRGTVNIDSSGAVNFSSTTATHLIGKLTVQNTVSLVFGAGSTLTLNNPNITADNPIEIQSTTLTTATFRTVTCDYINPGNAGAISITAANAAVTFGTLTAGAAGNKVNFSVTSASLVTSAVDCQTFYATLSGALTAGAITISSPTPSLQNVVNISPGASSTITSINFSAVTSGLYPNVLLRGTGAISVGAITGTTLTNLQNYLDISSSSTVTFTGTISAIDSFYQTTGNLVFTGALAIGIRERVTLAPGYTITPNTSVITIAGTAATGVAILDHAGYTLNSVVFPATASLQFIANSSNSSGLTVASLSSTGAVVPYSFLSLATNVTVTGTWTLTPNSIVNRHLVCSSVFGTARTITAATRSISTGADFQDITIAGAALNLAASSAGNAGGNTNITFPAAVTRYSVTGLSVNWDSTAAWSSTLGGAAGASVPLAHDIVNLSGSNSTISTNGRRYLGSSPVFGTFSGSIAITVTDTAIFLGSVDLTSVPYDVFNPVVSGGAIYILGRSALTFAPVAGGTAASLYIASTSSLSLSGPNDIIAATLFISGNSFSTDTGSRIANLSSGALTIGGNFYPQSIILGVYIPFSFAPLGTNNLNSSTITCNGADLADCIGTTTQITSSLNSIDFDRTINFTNSNITTLTGISFFSTSSVTLGTSQITSATCGFQGILNSSAATFYVSNSFTLSAVSWAEGTTQIVMRPRTTDNFSMSNFVTATINKVSLDDSLLPSGVTPLTSPLSFTVSNSSASSSFRQFDSSLLSRPLQILSSQFQSYGGINCVFSNKAWTYFRTTSIIVSGADPLYIPYVYCKDVTVTSGAVVAYGPANMGGNTGNITYPSKLRYYAFVDTATSMRVPADYNGMGLLLAVGGGATPSSVATVGSGKGGGGGGALSYTFLLPPNNATAPVVSGQTIYIRAGAYASAPVAGSAGGNGFQSWANFISNATPTLNTQGVLANGGNTTVSSNSGTGGGLTTVAHISMTGGEGSEAVASTGGGGGGAVRFGSIRSLTTNVASGGAGTTSSSLNTGRGGSGSVAGGAAGTAGNPPTAGTAGSASTGAGGGGGGGATYAPSSASTTSISRANGSTTTVFNVTSHGLTTGDQIYITSAPLQRTGTWSKSSSLITGSVTVNITSHGLVAGNLFYFNRTTGSVVPAGTYTVNTATTNSFTFIPSVTGTSTGNCALGQAGFSTPFLYSVTVNSSSQFQVTASVSTILYSGQLLVNYNPAIRNVNYRGANGGVGALNSAEQFIRYYNGAYTPGYFGIGGGGGGGGNVVSPSLNIANSGGNGGDGGIGCGGGGIGLSGNIVSTAIAATAVSGRGGPGLVMFIYALRANNQSYLQGL